MIVSYKAALLMPPLLLRAQGHWDIPSLRLPSACALASWAAVCLCPQQALSSQEPSGIASFLGDVVQVMRGGAWSGCMSRRCAAARRLLG